MLVVFFSLPVHLVYEKEISVEIKTARNWYWWLWLSPLLTLPTLLTILFESLWYETTTPSQAVTGVLISGAWHLILIKPTTHKTSRFVRWHGWQALVLAGVRTTIALLIGIISASIAQTFLILGLVAIWFGGTLAFQLEANQGYCTLWRWFGRKDQPLLEVKDGEIPDWKEGGGDDEDLDRDQQSESLQESEVVPPDEVQKPSGDALAEERPPTGQGINPLVWIGAGMGLLVMACLCLGLLSFQIITSLSSLDLLPTGSASSAPPTAIPATLTPEHLRRQEAWELVEEIELLSTQGRIEEALFNLEKALRLNPDVHIPSQTWNSLCWFGSLYGYPQEVYQACENAVAMWPGHGGYRDSRGLARALLGDYEGAIEDFEALINWAEVQNWDPSYAVKRRSWIEDLEQGINPFDEETLEELKRE